MLPTMFCVNWHFCLGEMKTWFSRWPPWQTSGFLIRKILAIFNQLVTPMLPPSFKAIGHSFQEKKQKIDFQAGCHGDHLGFPIRTTLAIFYLQITLMLLTRFQAIGLLSRRRKQEFRGRCCRTCWGKSHRSHNQKMVLKGVYFILSSA